MQLNPTVLKRAREAQAAQEAQAEATAAAAAASAAAPPTHLPTSEPSGCSGAPAPGVPPAPPQDRDATVQPPSPPPPAPVAENSPALPCPAIYAPIKRLRYTPSLAKKICNLVSAGHTVTAICSRSDMPGVASVFTWIRDHEDFRRQYYDAQRFAQERLGDQILHIVDDVSRDIVALKDRTGQTREVLNPVAVQRARVQVLARQRMIEQHKTKRNDPRYDEFGHPVPAPAKPVKAGFQLTEEDREEMMADWRAINDENARVAEEEKRRDQAMARGEIFDPPHYPGPSV